jgi:hypothetical protein
MAVTAVASAIWLIPASVHIAGWSASGPVRIAFLAPISRLWLAFVIAALAVAGLAALGWRREGYLEGYLDDLSRRLLPLAWLFLWLVPYVPWLPDRAPLLLLFAGPLRWVIAAVALVGVAGSWWPAAATRPPALALLALLALSRITVFVVGFALYAGLGVQYAREMGFGGDEPHYLIITHSLLADHDLDIANNHAQRDYRSFFAGELRPDFLRRGRHDEIYSIHAPGLPALLVPAYAAGGALGAVVFVALLAALTGLAIFDLAAALGGASAASLAWAATCFTVPFVPHAWLIYPELPGALIVAWAALWLWRPPVSIGRTALRGAALGALPWLHTKFTVFVALFLLFEAIRLWPRVKNIAALAAPVGLSGAAWLYSFYVMYGVADPEAPYGSYTRMFVLARNIPRGTLGLLFDQKFGLLAYSPVYVLIIAGAWAMLRDARQRAFAAALLVTAVVFFVSTTRLYMWWGGSSAPARFLVPIVPLLAPAIAVAIARITSVPGRAVVALALTISLAIAVTTVMSPGQELLYSDPHGVASLAKFVQGGAPLDASLPTFTEENWRAPMVVLAPWLAALAGVGLAIAAWARRGAMRSVFWTATAMAVGYIALSALLAGLRPLSNRTALTARGQLAVMDAYDPGRLRAVDLTHVKRLGGAEVLAAASLALRRAADAPVDNPHVLEGPFELPEGRYEARVWFAGDTPRSGDAFVGLSDQVILAKATPPLANPAVMPFDLPVRTPAFVGLSDADAARAVSRVDIVPVSIVPRSARDAAPSHVVEPIGGSRPGYMAYMDDHAYPEGGVLWTKDTEQSSIVVMTAGGSSLGLILHVGPTGGPVTVDAAGQRFDLQLGPGETRELSLPVAGRTRMLVSVRAARSFRPSEVDPKSDDHRKLGCQVRPLLR